MSKTTKNTKKPAAEEKTTKKNPIMWFWYAFQISKAGHIVPTLISPEFEDPYECKDWFKKMRNDGNLGSCTYRMAGWGSKLVIIE